MHQNIYTDLKNQILRSKRRNLFKRLVSIMACTVMFCTTYALILPAITMEPTTFCGVEEHSHSEKCYTAAKQNVLICNAEHLDIHAHSDSCYNPEGNLVCGLCDYVAHSHDTGCHNAAGELVCTLAERGVHVHGDGCYVPGETLPEVLHVHSDACNVLQRGELICTQEELEGHAHGDACYEPSDVLLCTKQENHVHVESCYEIPLVCTQSTEPHVHGTDCNGRGGLICNTTENHVHGDGCRETMVVCGNTEEDHSHGDGCYSSNIICSIPENHSHGDSCYESIIVCGKAEGECHSHESGCYGEQKLICTEDENHVHSGSCYEPHQICTMDEIPGHAHGDECYEQVTVIGCGLNEGEAEPTEPVEPVLVCTEPAAQVHVHGEGCFETVTVDANPICGNADEGHVHETACYELHCDLEEHEHSLACYSDPEADVESQKTWEATLSSVTLTGDRYDDVLAIARSQLGYTESTRNYAVWEDDSVHGYTRYGAWYGVPYGDWCGMFASFCLRYAGVNDLPINYGVRPWIEDLTALGLYHKSQDVTPKPGCLIFFDWEEDGLSDHVGIVEDVVDTDVVTIEGNSSNRVERNTYALQDGRIAGYAMLEKEQAPEEEDIITIDPNSTNAWAVLIDSNGKIMNTQEPQATYRLRNTRNVFMALPRAVGTPLNLTQYIKNVTMYDENGNVIPSGSLVTEGDEIEFQIAYNIDGQQLATMDKENDAISVITDTLIYDIPPTFEIVQDDSGNIVNQAGQTVGTYRIGNIDGKNRIIMEFSETYVTQNAGGLQIDGQISFFSIVKRITDEDSENQEHKFTDKITLGVVVEEEIDTTGDLTIEKNKISVEGEELIYELIVQSVSGTSGPITITDNMSEGLTFQQGVSVKKSDGSNVPNATFTPGTGNKSFTLELPEMAAGDTYTVRYKCKADIDLLGADMTVRNTAIVRGENSDGYPLRGSDTTDHTFEVLKKTGVDNKDGTITWTITVNQDKVDISGWTLEDILPSSKGDTPFTGPVNITDSSGKVIAQNVPLPYTFPEKSKDTYTVTYTTSYDYGNGSIIYNRAILKDNNTDITILAGTSIGSPVQKSGEKGEITYIGEKPVLPITWTVVIDTTAAAIPANEVLQDSLQEWGYNAEMYMTYDQLMAAYQNIKTELERVGSSIAEFEGVIYRYGMDNGPRYDLDELNSDAAKSAVYEGFTIKLGSAIPKGNVLHFAYQAYGVFDNDVIVGRVYANQFLIGTSFKDKATVVYSKGSVNATKFNMYRYDPTKPNNQFDWAHGGSDNYGEDEFDFEELHDGYLGWSIELSVPEEYASRGNIVLKEDLPEGVTVKGLDLTFLSEVPTKRLTMTNLGPGKSDKWTFTVLPADLYGTWQPQGGQEVTIDVVVTEAGDLEITIPGIVFETMSQRIPIENQWKPEGEKLTEWWGFLHIYTQIDKDFEWTPQGEGSYVYFNQFTNSFYLEDENGVPFDEGHISQNITKHDKYGTLQKKADVDNNGIITYSVVLNGFGKDLVENSDTLRIHDELTYTETAENPLRVRLVPGSVKLFEVADLQTSTNGTVTFEKGNEVKPTPAYHYVETSSEQSGVTTWHNTIDMTIKDGHAYILEYAYKPTGIENQRHNLLNTCTIEGVGEGVLDGNHKIEIQVKKANAIANTRGIMIFKVDDNSDGVYLENARFNIYIWNKDIVVDETTGEKGMYIPVHHPDNGGTDFVTDVNGMIRLDGTTVVEEQFAYNTAYYMVEVESPNGYYLSPEPYYFQIVNPDKDTYGECLPPNFKGDSLNSGDIIYRKNTSGATEITVEKYWKDYGGESMTVTGEKVSSVTLELWQMVDGDPSSAKVYGTYTMTPDENGKWSLTIKGLPKALQKTDGTKGTDYLYYVKEVAVNGFMLETSENNGGINSGTITLINREAEGYVLPETGGTGTTPYTMAGLMLMLFSTAFLMYSYPKRRKEVL